MSKVVIGLVGPIASGKGVVSEYLIGSGATHFSLSDVVRDEARRRGLPLTREILQNVGNELREQHGGHVLAERTVDSIHAIQGNLVIDSIRNPDEIRFLKEFCDILIVGVTAPAELRCAWYLNRSGSRAEDSATVEDFYKADGRDSGQGEGELGQQVNKCLQLADVIIENNGSKDQLLETLEVVIHERFGRGIEGHKNSPEKK